MDFLPKRLREIRERLNLSQSELADKASVSQRDVSELERGKKKFVPTSFIQFLIKQGIDVNALFMPGQYAIPPSAPAPVLADNAPTYSLSSTGIGTAQHVHVLIEDHDGNRLIPFVAERAVAGWAQGFADPTFYEELPLFTVPGFLLKTHAEYYFIETFGNSMTPSLRDRDLLLVRRIQNRYELRQGMVGVVLTHEGLQVKRFEPIMRGQLRLLSDNARYEPQTIALDEVVALFHVERRWTADLDNPLDTFLPLVDDVRQRLTRLEKQSISP